MRGLPEIIKADIAEIKRREELRDKAERDAKRKPIGSRIKWRSAAQYGLLGRVGSFANA